MSLVGKDHSEDRAVNQSNKAAGIGVSPLLLEAARREPDEVCKTLETTPAGLTQTEAEERLVRHGLNVVAQEKEHGWVWRLMMATRNPLLILLTFLPALSLPPRH